MKRVYIRVGGSLYRRQRDELKGTVMTCELAAKGSHSDKILLTSVDLYSNASVQPLSRL